MNPLVVSVTAASSSTSGRPASTAAPIIGIIARDGGLTAKDRASLDRLRAKLGLPEQDARALEAEIVPSASS